MQLMSWVRMLLLHPTHECVERHRWNGNRLYKGRRVVWKLRKIFVDFEDSYTKMGRTFQFCAVNSELCSLNAGSVHWPTC